MSLADYNLTHGGDIYRAEHQGLLDFSANINPLGLPQEVATAISANMAAYTAYPDPLCRELRQALATHHGLPMEQIVCGNGAADLIFRLVLGLRPKKALILAPTFGEYGAALTLAGCEIFYHFLTEADDFSLTPEALDWLLTKIVPGLDILFICNPNNPTGLPVSKQVMEVIAGKCKQAGTLLVVDECFNEFLPSEKEYSVIDSLQDNKSLLVLKAFTKFYAMAGIRLGYALGGDPMLIKQISQTLQPWSVSTPAAKGGVAALQAKAFAKKTKKLITINREWLLKSLEDLGLKVYESRANYVFFKCPTKDLVAKLIKEGVLIRSCGNYLGLTEEYYRVAVRGQEDNQKLVECLKKVLEA